MNKRMIKISHPGNDLTTIINQSVWVHNLLHGYICSVVLTNLNKKDILTNLLITCRLSQTNAVYGK